MQKANRLLKQLISAFQRLKIIYTSKEDLYQDFPESIYSFKKSITLLKKQSTINEAVIFKLCGLLQFKRAYSIIELADKISDLENWFFDSKVAAKNFCNHSKLSKVAVRMILNKYKKILLEGFLELAFRKGCGDTEVEAIRGFRYNMGGRLPEEYFVNLVRGWISEDLAKNWIIENTKRMSLKLISSAHDADRKIRFKSMRRGGGRVISGEPDFIVRRAGSRKDIYLEVQRTDRGRLKYVNKEGERQVNIPSHRPEVEKKAIKERKKLVLFLFNEGTKTISPEIAIVVNPKKNKKIRRTRDGETFVWAKFYSVATPESTNAVRKVFL